MNAYRESVNREVKQKLIERDAFRLALTLHGELCGVERGFSSRPNGVGPLNYGYMVSDGQSEVRVKTCTVETICRFMLEHWDKVATTNNLYFGGWQDGDYVYLDISEWVEDKYNAYRFSIEREQIAFYDLANRKSITL